MPKYTIHPQDIMIKFSALKVHDTSKLINDVLNDALDDVLEDEL